MVIRDEEDPSSRRTQANSDVADTRGSNTGSYLLQ